MREILFRGKRSDTGEWVYGDLRQDADLGTAYIGGWDYFTADYALQREPYEYPISPETVGQYTGLTDKNGNRIFEGDIVKLRRRRDYGIVKYAIPECRFEYLMQGDGDQLLFDDVDYVEIIGNIHDNPNLLT